MVREGVLETLRNYINSGLQVANTIFKVDGVSSREKGIRRGVKSDQLSPLLFNLVMSELLGMVNRSYEGALWNATRGFPSCPSPTILF